MKSTVQVKSLRLKFTSSLAFIYISAIPAALLAHRLSDMDDDLGQFIVAVLKDQLMIFRRLAACVCLLAFVVLTLAIVTFKKAS